MDRTWMKYPHTSEYIDGLREFLAKAENHLDSKGRTRCPCMKCKNTVFKHIDEVNKHIFRIGMQKDYNPWVFHGEAYEVLTDDDDDDIGEPMRYDGLEDLLEDIGASIHAHNVVPNAQQEVFVDGNAENEVDIGSIDEGEASYDKLMRDAHKPLYPGCTTFTMLEYLVKLLHAKTITNSSIKSFEMNLHILKKALPHGETLPKSYYEAKTMLRRLGLGYVKIHACVNDCLLFWKEHEHLDHCPTCKAPRYTSREGKSKKVPQKILRHFPLKQRLQRLSMSRITAEDMRWHKEKRVHEENVLRHPADSKVWDRFDKKHKWFADDSCNVRLGLASDGFNPFGDMSNAYSMWPVMLIPYNLPPWKCMKDPFIYMSLLIPGPTSPGNNIDVYLQPLIDELIELWEKGVVTYDAVSKFFFRMHAALLWTINDFPAYANLFGWSTKGKLACPNCNKDTFSMYLRNSHKLCYMNHARFLPRRHVLRRRAMRVFNGVDLDMTRPKKLSGFRVLKQLRHVKHQTFGRTSQPKRKRIKEELNWTKKSIFFQLPYWRTLNL